MTVFSPSTHLADGRLWFETPLVPAELGAAIDASLRVRQLLPRRNESLELCRPVDDDVELTAQAMTLR